jgi:hypothetical protein
MINKLGYKGSKQATTRWRGRRSRDALCSRWSRSPDVRDGDALDTVLAVAITASSNSGTVIRLETGNNPFAFSL